MEAHGFETSKAIEEHSSVRGKGSSSGNEKYVDQAEEHAESRNSVHMPTPDDTDTKAKGGIKCYFRVFGYADKLDRLLFVIAGICAIASGAALPLMTLVFGRSTSQFNNFSVNQQSSESFRNEVDSLCLWFVYLFIFRFVVTYVANFCVSIAAIRTTRALRSKFLECTLRQEVWHFDRDNIGSAASQVTTSELQASFNTRTSLTHPFIRWQ